MKRTTSQSGLTSIPRNNLATSSDVRSSTKIQTEMNSERGKRSLLQRRPTRTLTLKMSSICWYSRVLLLSQQ